MTTEMAAPALGYVLKTILGVFMLVGAALSLYAFYQILQTINVVRGSAERAEATFIGYRREEVETTSTNTSDLGGQELGKSHSFLSYPCFEYRAKDGSVQHVCESKAHPIEYFRHGQRVDIIIHPNHGPRLAGFYSLYGRDLALLAIGLGFIMVPWLLKSIALPSLEPPLSATESPVAAETERLWRERIYPRLAEPSLGSLSILALMKIVVGFTIVVVAVSLLAQMTAALGEIRIGTGWALLEAMEKEDYATARGLILERKGINKVNKYNQSPLLMALEGGQTELARMLVHAGADVNVKSKMYMTPLRVAAAGGHLEIVKLLVSKGALLDAPEDEYPPVIVALVKGHEDVVRFLIEAGSDLKRRYVTEKGYLAVGDIIRLAGKPELLEFR